MRERQILYDIIYIHIYGIFKNNANEFFCKTETDSQTEKINLVLPKGEREGTIT